MPEENRVLFLMCKDNPVYNTTEGVVINSKLAPGAIVRGTLTYSEWMKTRYSAGSNNSARRMMLRAFGSDNHNNTLKQTRALSLSDCYWLKYADEDILFKNVTPYLNAEWDGTGEFQGGSISTLFVNGAANKKWENSNTLVKYNSPKELIPFQLCEELGLDNIPKTRVDSNDFRIDNFTSTSYFLESMEQSGLVKGDINPRELAVSIFKEQAVGLFVVDYLVEHDDRHWGNYGFLRSADTGEYIGMAPYYDFDWSWSDGVIPLPRNASDGYPEFIKRLSAQALQASDKFPDEFRAVIVKRAKELLRVDGCPC